MDPINQTPIMTPPIPPKQEKSIGPAIGIIIIIIVIILGGLYFWGQRLAMQAPATTDTPLEAGSTNQVSPEQTQLQQIQTQNNQDDVSSIEADLNATDINTLGSEINSINVEAQGSAQ